MSWTDKIAVENIKQLQKDFGIKTALETGTFKGINAELYSLLFPHVVTCESNREYFEIACRRLTYCRNVTIRWESSPSVLADFPFYFSNTFIYLDAHFYDPTSEIKWVVIEELKALYGQRNIVLCIHDFDNGMGHLVYDGEHLDWKLIGGYLQKVNPDFHYYTNTECAPYTEETIKELPITINDDVLDAIRFVHSTPARENRGMLFATPLLIDLIHYKLKPF